MIAYLSPARGAKRLAARRAMHALSYEGARLSRREEGWVTGSMSANAEITTSRVTLRNRVRSLLRDNPYAAKAVTTLVANRIGTGIIAAPNGKNQRANKAIKDRWVRWIDECDYHGRTDFYGLQSLAERSRIESGESLIRFVPNRDAEDAAIPFRLQVIEPDFLDSSKNQRIADGHEIREGIEYMGGQRVAYWLFDSHPGESSPVLAPFSIKSQRYPAEDVIHYYRQTRPGQLTGVSEFAPVIRRLYDLDGYADAELLRKKIAACWVGWVTSPAGPMAGSLGPTSIGSDGKRVEQAEPGQILYGNAGESLSVFDPKPSDGFHEFFSEELHAIAAGLGFPYELLTGDFSQVNYSSFRGSLIQFKAAVESDQEQLIIPQIVEPIWRRFVLETALSTETMALAVPAKFTPPRFGLLDPAKETPAMIEAIQGGLRSWSDTVRRDGYDPDEVLDEIGKDQAEFDRRGFKFTSDGRNAVKAPAAPKAKEDEAA
jgi:lambda family phage portal protein